MKEAYSPIVDQEAVATAVVVENDGILTEEDPEGICFQDPFYENDNTVIAAFPFDHESLDRAMNHGWIVLAIFTALLLCALLIHYMFVFVGVIYLYLFVKVWNLRSKQYLRRRIHIAIATMGIYVDEVSEPNSRILMRRRIFKYEDYKHCYVERSELTTCGHTEYQVMMKNQSDVPIVFVKGLLGTQLFAEKVNVMIEQVAVQTNNAPTTASLV